MEHPNFKISGFEIGTTLPLDGLEQSWAHLSSWLSEPN
jgi:hypothetical protein